MRNLSKGSLEESRAEKKPEFALVLNGHSLVYALKPDLELLLLGTEPPILPGGGSDGLILSSCPDIHIAIYCINDTLIQQVGVLATLG